jgi:excisionase family DNA binding protein
VTLLIVELTPELAANIARGIVLRRQELASLGLTVPGLAAAEAIVAKQIRTGQETPPFCDPATLVDARPMRMTLTLDEAADELRVSPATVRRLVKTGQLATVKIERSTRVRRQDLEAYLAGLGPGSFRARVIEKGMAS